MHVLSRLRRLVRAMLDQCEYRVEFCEVGQHYDSMLGLYLKPLGREGWELSTLVTFPGPSEQTVHMKAYLKRRCVPQPQVKTTVWKCREEGDKDCPTRPKRPDSPPPTDILRLP